MADYEYPPLQLYLPLDFDLSLLISSHPIFPPYLQDFIGEAGYGWSDGPMMPTLPFEFDLALLSSAYNPYRRVAPYACFPQPYAHHYLPPQPPQVNVFLETPVVGVPVQLQPYYLQPPQLNVSGFGRQGTGVFHPHVTSSNTTTTRPRKRRGRRRRRNRKRKQEAKALNQKNTESSSQEKEKH